MSPIVSPKPLAVAISVGEAETMSLIPPSARDAPVRSPPQCSPLGPQRLMSPFRSDSARLQTSFILKSPYNATHRRRIAVNSRPYRRRTRNSLQFETVGAHIFDTLPWISALESSGNCSPSEIADLSQIHVQDRTHLDNTTGPGPVRRRKMSLRSKPFASGNADDVSCRSRHLFPREVIINANQSPPRTPLSRIVAPAAIRFHNLMPVYSDSDDFPYSHLAPSPPSLSSDPLA